VPPGTAGPPPVPPASAPRWPLDGPWGYDGTLYRSTTFLFTAYLVGLPLYALLRLLYRVEVLGREELPRQDGPLLVVSNHQSLIDSYVVCLLLGLVPEGLRRPRLIPFHAPEERNFMAGPLGRALHLALRCVPVRRGEGLEQVALDQLAELLRRGNTAYIFPEGTRSRTGAIGRATPGVGRVILRSGCTVLPVRLWGLDRILPVGRRLPRLGGQVRIRAGRPLPPDRFAGLPDTARGWLQASRLALDAVRDLQWPADHPG